MEIIKYYDKKEGWQLVNTTEETYKVCFNNNTDLMYSRFITGNSCVRLPYCTEFDYKDVEMTFEKANLKETNISIDEVSEYAKKEYGINIKKGDHYGLTFSWVLAALELNYPNSKEKNFDVIKLICGYIVNCVQVQEALTSSTKGDDLKVGDTYTLESGYKCEVVEILKDGGMVVKTLTKKQK